MKKKYFIIIFCCALFLSCHRKDNKSDAYGNFEADEIMVTAESNGKLLWLTIEEGMIVEKNQIVGMIDTMDLYLSKLQLENAVRSIKIGKISIKSEIDVLEQQKYNTIRECERLMNMFQDGAATQKQLDDVNGALSLIDKQILVASSKYNSVDSEIEATQIKIKQIDHYISKCKLESPIEGVVLNKYLQQSEFASVGKAVFKVANINKMILRAYITGDQLPHVNIGQKAEVLIDDSKNTNKILNGTVTWISSEAIFTPKIIQTKKERVNMVYPIKIVIENDGQIKSGMPGEVNFL